MFFWDKEKTDFNFIEDISSVDKKAFAKILKENDSPFIKYSFLEALEVSNSVSDINGCKVNHLYILIRVWVSLLWLSYYAQNFVV